MAETAATTAPRTAALKDSRFHTWSWIPGFTKRTMPPFSRLEVPVFAVLSWCYRAHFTWSLLGPMFALYLFKECFCMSICLHRFFAHKGFQCSRFTTWVLWVAGCLATQGPPLWWAQKHRKHHRHCDTKDDPHSPVAHGKFYAWVGWAYTEEAYYEPGWLDDYIKEYPNMVVAESFNAVPIYLLHLAFYQYGGIPWALNVSMFSGVLCQLLTMYFNVAFHENDKATGVCKALDNPYDPLSQIFGEAYHDWHHVNPRAYHRPGLDLPYWLIIKPMLMLGVFTGKNVLFRKNK